MDGKRFDALSRSLATVGTRRGIVRLLGALPLVGALLTVVDDESSGARRRRKNQRRRAHRRAKVHEQKKDKQKSNHKEKRKHEEKKDHRKKKKDKPASSPATSPRPPDAGCTPESAAQTCAGRCGQIPNTCGTTVDCGSCACPVVCPICQTCNTTTGHCEANPAFLGQVCAAPGQVCQANGACTCDDGSCPSGQRCNGQACICDETSCAGSGRFCLPDGACACDSESCPAGQRCRRSVCICDATSCASGCCDGGSNCQAGNDDGACGTGGNACQSCTSLGQRCGGGGTPRSCGCASDATTCAGKCGLVENNCGQTIDCTALCAGCCAGDGSCQPGTSDAACGASGDPCFRCDAPDACFEAACCTQTTCAALYQSMCQIPGDCDYGICGTFPDTCGGLDCGPCLDGHPCFACENNICVNIPGSRVCGNACCFNSCCVNPNQGLCGAAQTCLGGDCCPVGFDCCDARDGSRNSTCYNLLTYCQGMGILCCEAGNTCCPDEPCCTSNANCSGGKTCHFGGSGVSGAGCCRF